MIMRVPLIAGNWKMFKTKAEAKAFAEEFRELYRPSGKPSVVTVPPLAMLARLIMN